MSMKQTHRKIERTPEEAARLREVRERYQRDKPTPEELLTESGQTEFTTLGEVLLLHQAITLLKQERERQNVTLAELAERTGMDQAMLSRLETGRHDNPTINTLARIAVALGKEIHCALRDAPPPPKRKTIPA